MAGGPTFKAKPDEASKVPTTIIPNAKFPVPIQTLELITEQDINLKVNNVVSILTTPPFLRSPDGRKILNPNFKPEVIINNLEAIEKAEPKDLIKLLEKDSDYKKLYVATMRYVLPSIIMNKDYDELDQRDFNYRERATNCYLKLRYLVPNLIVVDPEMQKTLVVQLENTHNVKLRNDTINSFGTVGNVSDEVFNSLKKIANNNRDIHQLDALQAMMKAVLKVNGFEKKPPRIEMEIDQSRLKEVLKLIERTIPSNEDLRKDKKKEEPLERLIIISAELALQIEPLNKMENSEFGLVNKKLYQHLETGELSGKSILSVLLYFRAVCSNKNNEEMINSMDQLTKLIEKSNKNNWGTIEQDGKNVTINSIFLKSEIEATKEYIRKKIKFDQEKENFWNGKMPRPLKINDDTF